MAVMGGPLCRSGRYWGTWVQRAWMVRPMGCVDALDSGWQTDCGNRERGGSTVGVSALTGAADASRARVSSWSRLIWASSLSSSVGSVGDSLVKLMCQSDGPVYNVVQCDSNSQVLLSERCVSLGDHKVMPGGVGGVCGLWLHKHTSVLHQQAGNLASTMAVGVLAIGELEFEVAAVEIRLARGTIGRAKTLNRKFC